MKPWVKNLIGVGIFLVIISFAWKVLNGGDTEIEIWEFKAKNTSNTANIDSSPMSTNPILLECRLPEHGIESWGETQSWTADSGWRKGGSSPSQFCGSQKIARETKYPNRKVVLVDSGEKHKTERTPFKHDYYRYSCVFEDKWNPVYYLKENDKCGI